MTGILHIEGDGVTLDEPIKIKGYELLMNWSDWVAQLKKM